jgi:hypothetical protein
MRVRELRTRSLSDRLRRLGAWFRPRAPIIQVRRRELPYWRERGWTLKGNAYEGSYQTPYGAFLGFIEDCGGGYFRFFIFDPPQEVLQGSHSACFRNIKEGWYDVHMAERPQDASSGIMTIERLMVTTLKRPN